MKTKVISLAVIFLLSMPDGFSQRHPKGDTGVHLGIIAGVNLQNLNGTDFWGEKLDNDFIIGFNAGVNVNIPIAPDFYIQPGLMFSAKGGKQKVIESPSKAEGNEVTTKVSINYLEVPVNLLFRPQAGDGHLLIGFGPYIGYGIFGKVKTKEGSLSNELDIKFKNTVTSSDPSTSSYMRPLDAGGTILFGYELFNGLFFQLNGQLGLLKINPEYENLTNNKTSIKNFGFGLSAGYRF